MGEVELCDRLVHHLKKVVVVVLVQMVQGVHIGNVVMVDTNLVVIGILQEVSSGTVVMTHTNQAVNMDFEVMARMNQAVSMGFGVMAQLNLAVGPTLLQGVYTGLVAMALTNLEGEMLVV
jgi:hypothetical protein